MENNNAKFRRKIQQEVHALVKLRALSRRYELVGARVDNKRLKVNLKMDEILEAMAQRELIKMIQRKDDRVNK